MLSSTTPMPCFALCAQPCETLIQCVFCVCACAYAIIPTFCRAFAMCVARIRQLWQSGGGSRTPQTVHQKRLQLMNDILPTRIGRTSSTVPMFDAELYAGWVRAHTHICGRVRIIRYLRIATLRATVVAQQLITSAWNTHSTAYFEYIYRAQWDIRGITIFAAIRRIREFLFLLLVRNIWFAHYMELHHWNEYPRMNRGWYSMWMWWLNC